MQRSRRSAGSGARLGTNRCNASLTVAPESPHARQTAGRPVWRARARAVTAVTVSSPRESPTPDTDNSPIPTTRIGSPAPGTFPSWGRFAAGSCGTRRRVAEPCAHASGKRASEPAKPVTTVERDIVGGPEAAPPPLIEPVAGAPPKTRPGAKHPAHHRLITAILLPNSSKRANAYPGTGVPGPRDVPSICEDPAGRARHLPAVDPNRAA